MEHWDDEYQEHVLTYKEGDMMCILFYPTTRSLKVSTIAPTASVL